MGCPSRGPSVCAGGAPSLAVAGGSLVPGSGPPPLRIAAAADLQSVLPKIAKAFTRKTGTAVSVSYGSSGVLFLQALRHAPFDVFMSADSFYPARLLRQGDGVAGTERVYARGGLVLWFSKKPDLAGDKSPIHALMDPSIGRLRWQPPGSLLMAVLPCIA